MNSDSGKPIYSCNIQNSRTNSSHHHHSTSLTSQISTICSIIHTLQTLSLSVSSSSYSSGLGHLQSVMIHSNNANDVSTTANDRIVFMHVPPRFTFIVLVVGNVGGRSGVVDSYIRVRLEYIYTRLIMTCTDIASSSIYHHPYYYTNNGNNNNNNSNNDDDVEQVFQQNQHFISSLFETRRCSSKSHHHHHSIHPASILTSGILPASFYNHNYSNNNDNSYHRVRLNISKMIQQHIHSTTATTTIEGTTSSTAPPSIIAALLFVHQQYITILQHTATILHGSDLVLIPSFLQRQLMSSSSLSASASVQHHSSANEVWVPFCLPRLFSSGYVHCYATNIEIHRVDDVSNNKTKMSATTTTMPSVAVATLCLISTIGTTDEFQILRTISQRICQSIREGDVSLDENILDDNSYCDDNSNDDQDYELIASFSDVPSTLIESMNNTKISSSNYNAHTNYDLHNNNRVIATNNLHPNNAISLLSAIQTMIDGTTSGTESSSLSLRWEDWIEQRYLRCNDDNKINNNKIVITHFVFRVNVAMVYSDKYIRRIDNDKKNSKNRSKQQRHGNDEHLVQCICSSYCDHHGDTTASRQQKQHRLWIMYHNLQLRLRCGTSNSTEALRYTIGCDRNMTERQNDHDKTLKSKPSTARNTKPAEAIRPATIDVNCPMIVLSETLPKIDGMTYVTENDNITYFAMNGNGFELYVDRFRKLLSVKCRSLQHLIVFAFFVIGCTLFLRTDTCVPKRQHRIHTLGTLTMTRSMMGKIIQPSHYHHHRLKLFPNWVPT